MSGNVRAACTAARTGRLPHPAPLHCRLRRLPAQRPHRRRRERHSQKNADLGLVTQLAVNLALVGFDRQIVRFGCNPNHHHQRCAQDSPRRMHPPPPIKSLHETNHNIRATHPRVPSPACRPQTLFSGSPAPSARPPEPPQDAAANCNWKPATSRRRRRRESQSDRPTSAEATRDPAPENLPSRTPDRRHPPPSSSLLAARTGMIS